MSKVLKNGYELIGYSPIVELSSYAKYKGVNAKIYAKLEWFSLAGSIKDKVALQMITDLETQGKIKKGDTLIEPTSGNTGIGISAVGAIKGYKVIIVMPDNMSIEKQKIIKAYGAQVVLTPASLGMQGAIEQAKKLNAEIKGSVILGQFDNLSNVKAHYIRTGKEILDLVNVDTFIAGIGTGGTITGTGKYLKENKPSVKVIGVEPYSSPLITKGESGNHKIQGIGANFIPSIYDAKYIDSVQTVTNEDAYTAVKEIALTEGILVGISSGANAVVAINQAKQNPNQNVVFICADSGERYISSDLFM